MNRLVPHQTIEKQRAASDPAASAWVSAHAGSGKTHVLTQRVVRLLLAGVPPSRLICLTFTKAAAANMSERIFRTLAGWTLMDDDALREAIAATGARAPKDLDVARRLFAIAVETPGGLKIQTIHAFCERVLHLFPFEANVPADFRVVEDLERAELMRMARLQTLEAAATDPKLGAALARVAAETWDGGFVKALDAALREPDLLQDLDGTLARLPGALGLAKGETEASILRAIVEDGIHCDEWARIAAILQQGKATDCERADAFSRAAAHAPGSGCIEHYFKVFFTKDGDLRKSVATKAIDKISPGLPARLLDEGHRIAGLNDKLRAAATLARTSALLSLARECARRYEASKRARSLLDFDDLIARTRSLLTREGASAWVLYKLDGGVDHILVDEAQDTSEAQWDILRALSAEFSVGEGVHVRKRTFFAVGDEKQSIFSFQGAAPKSFWTMRDEFEKRVRGAGDRFERVELDLSFRSGKLVLEAVDKVFASAVANRGLTVDPDQPPRHAALKYDVAGMVELWEPIRAEKAEDPTSWALPVDLPRETDPPVELARRIAKKIAALIAPGSRERVAGDAPQTLRPIAPGDVMILVRRRGAFFNAMVRALKEERVPVAGADRLDVGQHIAVMDMIAAARAALAPDDDLSLACVLKSPLIGLDDDDLIAIAPGRKHSLWRALAASSEARHRAAADRIGGWRARAAEAKPFDFLSRLLGPEGGRKAFLARMGPEAGDALDELLALALAHERQQAPSLPAFVHEIETLDLTVRRDMEAKSDLVRVMTAHAAKGLEARIVVLPDTCAAPSASHDPVLFQLDTPAGPTLAWSQRRNDDPQAVTAVRERKRDDADDEYRRLLYVAMTRAEERLYICGYAGAKDPPANCWYALVREALEPHCDSLADPDRPDAVILRYGAPLLAEPKEAELAPVLAALPAWLTRPAPQESTPAPPLRPSSALAGADAMERIAHSEADDPASSVSRGALIHALMQALPDIPADRRFEAALRYVRAKSPGLGKTDRETLALEAVAAMEHPDCAPLFSPDSRAELSVSARIERAGRASVDIVGRIDRLAECGTDVWIADFKTGVATPELRRAYLLQLALYRAAVALLYPERNVRAFILWTGKCRLEELAADELDAALASI